MLRTWSRASKAVVVVSAMLSSSVASAQMLSDQGPPLHRVVHRNTFALRYNPLGLLYDGRFMYRLRVRGIEQVPEEGAALLICNHVSFVDAIVISAACRRPVRFIMDSGIFRIPLLRSVFRGMKAVPIAPRSADPALYERAFATVAEELAAGHLVCIFPEGKLTRDGAIDEFKPGLLRILQRSPVTVVPMALSNLWPSMFSRREPTLWKRWPRRALARVTLAVGEPMAAQEVTLEAARERVAALRLSP